MATLNAQGLVVLTPAELAATAFVHLLSGVDDDRPATPDHGATSTTITGYTEWLSASEPAVTLGWDWQLTARNGLLQLGRIGPPRSNLEIDDSSLHNAGQAETLLKVEQFVDTLERQPAVLRALGFPSA